MMLKFLSYSDYKEIKYYKATRLPWWLSGKESTYQSGDAGLIPGLGRSLGGGNGYPLQYSCLGNHIDRGTWWATAQGWQRLGCDLVCMQNVQPQEF